jgi:hypothetical protein
VQTHATPGRLYDIYEASCPSRAALAAVRDWAERHVADVLAAQTEHDKNHQPSSSGSQ